MITSNKVFKYVIGSQCTEHMIPKDAIFLTCLLDPATGRVPALYFLVDEDREKESRRFTNYYTGEAVNEKLIAYSHGVSTYLGTAINIHGIVMHVFEDKVI